VTGQLGGDTVNACQLRIYTKNNSGFLGLKCFLDTQKGGLRKSQLQDQVAFSLKCIFSTEK